MVFPEMPPELRTSLPSQFWNWWQAFKSFLSFGMHTRGDVEFLTAAKGVILRNAAGTVVKRARLNDAGDGWIFENP